MKNKKDNENVPSEECQEPISPNFDATAVDDALKCETKIDADVPKQTPSAAEKLAEELEEQKQKLLYLQADYQNYRKRMLKEISDARMLGVSTTLDPFLRVFDYLMMARNAAEKSDNIDSMRQGIAMIIGEYVKAFDDLGVKKAESVGKPFNPEWQEAVAQEASENAPEGVVIKEWSSAYKLGERFLRPAKVVVSSGMPKKEEAAENAE